MNEEHIDRQENLVQKEDKSQIDEEKRVRDILQAARECDLEAVYDDEFGELLDEENPEAQIVMGDRCFKWGDHSLAVEWYRRAADQGHAEAQSKLGVMYGSGREIAQDYEAAAKWYRKAAKQGDVTAQYNLGWMYYYGQGVGKDDKEATKWFKKSADQGYIDAQRSLDVMYAESLDVTSNDKASDQDNKYNKEIINIINGEAIRVTVDVYDVIDSFGVTCPALQHAIKKILFAGERGHKNKNQDLNEALQSISRAIQLETVRNKRDD